jgi:hypothetical protein
MNQASRATGIDAQPFKNTYLDKPRQLMGRHWRRLGQKYWQPVKQFECDTENLETAAANYIMARPLDDTTDFKIYESRNAAKKRLQLVAGDRQLDNAINKGTEFQGCMWSENLHRDVYGSSHEDEKDWADLRKDWVQGTESGESDRCNGRIVAFSITENVDRFHTTA